jgi:hypothetical protein
MDDTPSRDEPEQTTPAGYRIPIPKREDFERMLRKLAPPAGRKRPDETDAPPRAIRAIGTPSAWASRMRSRSSSVA